MNATLAATFHTSKSTHHPQNKHHTSDISRDMKTPKRNYKIPAERQHLDIEPDSWDEDDKQQEARWHRKNRIRQLKHTIARQAKEIEHYKNLLALAIIGEHYKLSQHCFDWAAKHICVGMHPSSFDLDKNNPAANRHHSRAGRLHRRPEIPHLIIHQNLHQTMTNAELQAQLKQYPDDLPVFFEPSKPPTAYGEIYEVRLDHTMISMNPEDSTDRFTGIILAPEWAD